MKGYQWALLIVGLFLGMMLTVQYRVTRDIQMTEPVQRAKLLSAQVAQMRNDRDDLQARVNFLRARLDEATAGPQASALREELDLARMVAGAVDMYGPGVEVTLNDSNVALLPGQDPNLFVLHDEDILRVLNELKAAGAEAISINGQRLLATTEVRCSGPTILLNRDRRLAPPYVITAIGDPETLESSLKMKGGVVETLKFWGIQAVIKKSPQVTVPAYGGGFRFEYARESG